MKHLFEQIVKFGLVGVVATLIDFGLYTGCNLLGVPYLISGFIGFAVSLIFNYVLSMKFVFEHRDDISRRQEFVMFLLLSMVGLLLNEVFLYIGMDLIYGNAPALQNMMNKTLAQTVVKILTTALVMIYNFISRKVFLEKRKM